MIKSTLLLIVGSLITSFSMPNKSGPVSGFDAWWFMGGDEVHVVPSGTSNGIQNLVDGVDTVGESDAWKYDSKLPNCHGVSSASYIENAFSIEGDHEVSFSFSIDCVTPSGELNYQSKNGSNIDIFAYDVATNNQLCSLRIWIDSGGYICGNHSYFLGSGNNYPSATYTGMNWINGDAHLNSSFQINFSKKSLFRSYVNNDNSKLVRLDTASNDFYNNTASLLEGVDKVYFRIKGDGGWQKTATIILKQINGQSLSVNDGKINDNVGPDLITTSIIPSTIDQNVSYTIPVKAVDVLSTPSVEYYYDGTLLTGNSFTPTETGSHSFKVVATDGVGNVTQKEFPINVTGVIAPPVITSVPSIDNQRLSIGSVFRCGVPTYTDESGLATVSATIQNIDTSSTPKSLTYSSLEDDFFISIDNTFVSGNYGVTYTVTNSAGSDVSSPVTFELEVYEIPSVDFVTYDEGISVKYVDEGILIHSIGRWRKTSFGVFDIRQGIDAYFTIPILSENGEANTASYFDMKVTNYENSNYWIMYRLWLNVEFLTNDSSPTNMYFNFGTPGNEQCVDVGDCGWLTRTVDGVDGRFHYNYNTNDGFSGEFRKVLQPAKGVANYTSRFFDESPSNNFIIEFYVASRDGGIGDDQNSEFIMNELNDQNFENEEGVLKSYARPKVSIGSINKVYLAHSTSSVHVYVKDILNLHPITYVRVSREDKTVVSEYSYTTSEVPLIIPEPGLYRLKIFTVNKLGKEVGSTFDIEARSSITPVTVTVNGSYSSMFEKGDKITVLDASYSLNADLSKSKIYLKYNNTETEVKVGDQITFDRAGMYSLIYYACDTAIPNVNETFQRYSLNVIDRDKPIVNVTINSMFRAEEEVNIHVDVVDDTDCDIAIILTDMNGYKTIYTSSDVSFIPEQMGNYELMIRVEDAYNNISIENRTLIIDKKAPNKTLISWIVIGIIFSLVLGAFITLTIITKIKANKERIL